MGKPWDPKPIGRTMEGKPTEVLPDIVAGTGASDLTNSRSSIAKMAFLMDWANVGT